MRYAISMAAALFLGHAAFAQNEKPIPEAWDYTAAMKKVAGRFKGNEGVVLHIGDSMTIANPYTTWARSGKGKSAADEAVLKWIHTGANNKTDGWWLCRTEVVHERAYTAVGGMQSTHLLNGGNRDNPPLAKMLEEFKPRMAIVCVGIYDADAKRPVKEFKENMAKAVDQMLENGTICILSTYAPYHARLELSKEHNEALREIAKEKGLPLIDLEKEILTRRPNDWNGTLQRKNNIHLTASEAGGNPGAAPTAENLGKSGYLLRSWLSVQKVAEVKQRVLDAPPEQSKEGLAVRLQKLDGRAIVLGTVRTQPLANMLERDARAGLQAANRADTRAWEQVQDKAGWERFRDARIEALRASLGQFPEAPKDLKVKVTGSLEGDGYKVQNLVFESRPGLIVTANLYTPAKPPAAMPGMVIVHSHHEPKNTSARQDMAMTWARAGCAVLVPDHLGHGERRQHPFASAADYKGEFFLRRQDYQFRHDMALQLHAIGDSLMGWYAWDLARGVDVLLAQPGVDRERIVLVSEPSGGGDIAAVAMALDKRIAGNVVTNFGGPQPESPYPLPRDAEQSFDYAGSGSWESTRNLRSSARDGFLPWTIVAAAAPRKTLYNHEFYWDRDNDPVWKRLQKVYGFYEAPQALDGAAGRGFVVGSEPENWHWIAVNREIMYPTLERWFKIANPKKEYSKRRPPEELLCLTSEVLKEYQPQTLHDLAGRLGAERAAAARQRLEKLSPAERRTQLRRDWARLLGDVTPAADPVVRETHQENLDGITVERIQLVPEAGILVPVLLLTPPRSKETKLPVVLAVSQAGKQEFLRQRADTVAELLAAGVAVCLPDLRGTGETSPGERRDRGSPSTNISASGLMLGRPLLGARLRDVQSVLRHLRQRPELDGKRIALWGDSMAAVNAPDLDLRVPHGVDNRPAQSEPLGGLLALLAALFDDDVQAVAGQGGLSGYQALLQSSFTYVPHDAVVPGALTASDLCDVAAALAPRAMRLEGLVDGVNRRVPADTLAKTYQPTTAAYRAAGALDKLRIASTPEEKTLARWLAEQVK